jgi:hypothetical protein
MYGDLVRALNAVTTDTVTVEAATTVASGRAAFSANASSGGRTSGTLKVLSSSIPTDTTKAIHNKEYGIFVSTAHELAHALHNALSQSGARDQARAAAANLISDAGWPAIALHGVSANNALDSEMYAFAVQTAFTRVLVEGCGISAGRAGHDQLADTYYAGAAPSDYVSTIGFTLAAFKTGGYLRATIEAYGRLYGANPQVWLTSGGGEEIAKGVTLHTALFNYYKDHSTRPTEPAVPDAPTPDTWAAEQWAPAQRCVHALRVAVQLYAPLSHEAEGHAMTALDLFPALKDKRLDQRVKAVADFRAAAARALRVHLEAATKLTEACEK